jgi:hypothetical protein
LWQFKSFRYCTKVDANLAELALLTPKFAKRSCIGNFCEERTRSPPLDPKTHVLGHFGPFRDSMKVDSKLAEQVPLTLNFAKQSDDKKFRNERT